MIDDNSLHIPFLYNQNNLINFINSQRTQKNNREMGNDSRQFLAQFVKPMWINVHIFWKYLISCSLECFLYSFKICKSSLVGPFFIVACSSSRAFGTWSVLPFLDVAFLTGTGSGSFSWGLGSVLSPPPPPCIIISKTLNVYFEKTIHSTKYYVRFVKSTHFSLF